MSQRATEEVHFGARVSGLDNWGTVVVEQTSRKHPGAGNNPYTADHGPDGKPICRFVRFDSDQEIRDALRGCLGEAAKPGKPPAADEE